MKKNMGVVDKSIRIIVALVLIVLFFTDAITGTLGIVLLVIAAIFAITSVFSFCPLYPLLGINTCKKKV